MNFVRKITTFLKILIRNSGKSAYDEEGDIEMPSTSLERSISDLHDSIVMTASASPFNSFTPTPKSSGSSKSSKTSTKSRRRLEISRASSKVSSFIKQLAFLRNTSTGTDGRRANSHHSDDTDNVESLSGDASPTKSEPGDYLPGNALPRKSILKPAPRERETPQSVAKQDDIAGRTVRFSDGNDSGEIRRTISSLDINNDLHRESSRLHSNASSYVSGFDTSAADTTSDEVGIVDSTADNTVGETSVESVAHEEDKVVDLKTKRGRHQMDYVARSGDAPVSVESSSKLFHLPKREISSSSSTSSDSISSDKSMKSVESLKSWESAEIKRNFESKETEESKEGKNIRGESPQSRPTRVPSDDAMLLIRKEALALGAPRKRITSNITIREDSVTVDEREKIKKGRRSAGKATKEKSIRTETRDGGLEEQMRQQELEALQRQEAQDKAEQYRQQMEKTSDEFAQTLKEMEIRGSSASSSDENVERARASSVTRMTGVSKGSRSQIIDFTEFFDDVVASTYGIAQSSSASEKVSNMGWMADTANDIAGLYHLFELQYGGLSTADSDASVASRRARTSLTPELCADHQETTCCKRRVYSLPVSMQMAQFQYRDLHRKDLVRLFRKHMNVQKFDEDFILPIVLTRKQRFKAFFLRIFRYGLSSNAIILTNFEFYALMIFSQVNSKQLDKDFQIIELLGPVVGMAVRLFSVIFIDAPLMLFILNMSGTTRFGYIKLYNAMPIIRGIGYGMFAVFLVDEARSAGIMGIGAMLVIRFFSIRKGWESCHVQLGSKAERWNELCIPYPTNTTHNVKCPEKHTRWEGTENFAMQNFLRSLLGHLEPSNMEVYVQYTLDIILWMVTFALAWSGFERTRQFITKMLLVLTPPLMLTCVSLVVCRYFVTEIEYHWYPLDRFFNHMTNSHLINLSLPFLQLPFLVWVASMKPVQADPEVITALMIVIKVITYLVIFCASQVCIFHVIEKYKLNPDCSPFESHVYLYGLVPEFFSQTILGSLVPPCWWTVLNCFIFLRAVCVLQLAIRTFCEVLPALRRFPFFVSAALCFGCVLILQLHRYKPASLFFNALFLRGVDQCIIIMFGLFMLGLRFLYTWTRWSDDFTSTYSRYPMVIWNWWLDSTAIISLVLIAYVIVVVVYVFNVTADRGLMALGIIISMSGLTFAFVLKYVCHFTAIHRTSLSIRPTKAWDIALKTHRRSYFSQREIRQRKTGERYARLYDVDAYHLVVIKQRLRLIGERESEDSRTYEESKQSIISRKTTWVAIAYGNDRNQEMPFNNNMN